MQRVVCPLTFCGGSQAGNCVMAFAMGLQAARRDKSEMGTALKGPSAGEEVNKANTHPP
jgi:hypothetical protein